MFIRSMLFNQFQQRKGVVVRLRNSHLEGGDVAYATGASCLGSPPPTAADVQCCRGAAMRVVSRTFKWQKSRGFSNGKEVENGKEKEVEISGGT